MELEGLLQLLRAAGADSLTITLRPPGTLLESPRIDPHPPTQPDAPPEPQVNLEATERVQAVIDQLKLNDEQLADTIFPER